MVDEEVNKIYSNEARVYWNLEYKTHGYRVVHNAGTEEKTEKLAEKEIDLFLFPTQKKCQELLKDKENNPWPTFHKDFARKHKKITTYRKDLAKKIALDYGCGILGRYTFALAKYFKQVYGVDVSTEAVIGAKTKKIKNGSKNTIFILNDGKKIPLSDKSVDFIFSNLVLQHIGYKEINNLLVGEFSRIAKPGAVCRLEYFYAEDGSSGSEEAFSVVEGVGFSTEEIEILYAANNFKIVSVSNKHPYLWITATKGE